MFGSEAPGGRARWPTIVVVLAGAAVAALGLVSLLGWVFDLPLLTSSGFGRLPMAPSSALLFVVHGLVLGLRARPVLGRRAALARGLVGLATVAALPLLVLSAIGIHSPVEHLGMDIADDLNGVPIGHMAFATAACFLLAGISALLTLPTSSVRSARGLVASCSAGALLGVSFLCLLAYVYARHLPYSRPLLYEGRVIPPALASVLAFAALGLGLFVAIERERAAPRALHGSPPVLGWYLLAFGLLALGTIAAGDAHYEGYARQYRAEVERQLSAVADLKVREIVQWRRERLGDGLVFFGHESFSALVQRYFDVPGDRQQTAARLRNWLRRVREAYQYDRAFLLGTDGAEVISDPATPEPVAPHLRQAVPECLRSARVSLLDFHRDGPGRPIRLSVMVPIYAGNDRARPLGVVALRIDPAVHLYPALRRWPTLSRSAETLLVRRDGNDVLFLNDLRFHEHAALSLRVPLSNTSLPAAMAVRGKKGIVEGVDYRGVDVIAAVRPVPQSPWFLVARMDRAEVYAPLGERLWQMIVLVATVLFGAGAALGLLSRRHRMHFYRERYEAAEALRASEAALRQRNDELTRFTYTVSHDLKSPLVTIQTFVGYLQQDFAKDDDQAVEKDLGFIRTAAQKMSRLLDDLLELSRVGRKMNPPEEVPLQAVAGEALSLVAGRIAERAARVEVTDEPVVLFGDRLRLVEVYQNLLDNAVKFMGEQALPLVEIGVEGSDGEPVLFVRDNGAGIDPRHIAKLFGLFEKLDPKSEGTGVGLALVRRILETHGGRIWVESQGPGRGACFRFTLPRARRASRKEPS